MLASPGGLAPLLWESLVHLCKISQALTLQEYAYLFEVPNFIQGAAQENFHFYSRNSLLFLLIYWSKSKNHNIMAAFFLSAMSTYELAEVVSGDYDVCVVYLIIRHDITWSKLSSEFREWNVFIYISTSDFNRWKLFFCLQIVWDSDNVFFPPRMYFALMLEIQLNNWSNNAFIFGNYVSELWEFCVDFVPQNGSYSILYGNHNIRVFRLECRLIFYLRYKILRSASSNFNRKQSLLFYFLTFCSSTFNFLWKYYRCTFLPLASISEDISTVYSYTHTERQAARQGSAAAPRSHWNALWRSKMGPRSNPKHHSKHQNFKAAAWCLTLDAWRLTLGVFIPLDGKKNIINVIMFVSLNTHALILKSI